jgi:hypothetical protein
VEKKNESRTPVRTVGGGRGGAGTDLVARDGLVHDDLGAVGGEALDLVRHYAVHGLAPEGIHRLHPTARPPAAAATTAMTGRISAYTKTGTGRNSKRSEDNARESLAHSIACRPKRYRATGGGGPGALCSACAERKAGGQSRAIGQAGTRRQRAKLVVLFRPR